MAHCKYTDIEDLETALSEIRKLEMLKETKLGIFYLKSKGFLHFHINKEGKRWADIRDGDSWGSEYAVPEKVSKAYLKKFVLEVQRRYRNCTKLAK